MKQYEKWPRLVKRLGGKFYEEGNWPKAGTFYALWRDEGQKHHHTSLKTGNLTEATGKYNRLLENVSKGVLGFTVNPKSFPFPEAVDMYLRDGVANLAPSTLKRYKEALGKNIKPFFKTMSVRAIKPKTIVEYLQFRRKSEHFAEWTERKEKNILSAIFNFLMEEEILGSNPALAIKKKMRKLKVRRPNYSPTEAELYRILEHLFKGARNFAIAFMNTGCRLSELSNTDVADVDLEQGFLRITRKGGKVAVIKLNNIAVQAIKDALAGREDLKSNSPIFLNQYKTRYKKMRKALKTACEKAKVPHCTHHSLRHAYANFLRKKKTDTGTISKLLGHANPTITQNIYFHWRDEEVDQAAMDVEICPKSVQQGN